MIRNSAHPAQLEWQHRVATCRTTEDWLRVQRTYAAMIEPGVTDRSPYWYLEPA